MSDARYHAFKTEERKTLTDQQRAKLFLDRGGRCHKCSRKLGPADKWIVEHVIALENGGDNEWGNLDVTCSWCLPKKNAEDAAQAAKTREIAVSHIVPREQRKRKGPPMPGSRASRWKHKLDGSKVKR